MQIYSISDLIRLMYDLKIKNYINIIRKDYKYEGIIYGLNINNLSIDLKIEDKFIKHLSKDDLIGSEIIKRGE